MAETLLRTKLFFPPPRPNLVPRHHLTERLNQGLRLGHRLALVSAPAGFGKTTLVGEWVGNLRRKASQESRIRKEQRADVLRTVWLSLDASDNDPVRFLRYLFAALNQVEGVEASFGEGALAERQAPETVLTALINDIAAIPEVIVFVLDDYHVITSTPIDEMLTFLLEHLPAQLHLVIATRDDPDLPLARFRARGQLTELRAADLRFSTSEAAEFLNRVMGLDLTPADILALETRTEGWIAGLQLAAISIQGQADPQSRIKSFTGSHRFVLDYLIEEVLARQPENVQSFLLQTAVLDRLTGSLCDAVTGRDDGQQFLELLERSNLFIIPLDGERQWYRYHHLFADLLRQRLRQTDLGQMPTLHSRASEWYEQNGFSKAAITHSLHAEDFERAANLAELAWPKMHAGYQTTEWLGWAQALPDELVRARPVLSVAYAQALLNTGKLEAAAARLVDAERWLEPTDGGHDNPDAPAAEMIVVDEAQFRLLPVSLATARAYHAQSNGDLAGSVKYARRILDLVPEGERQWRGGASSLLGLAQYANGDLAAAEQNFTAGMEYMDPLEAITGTFVVADMKMAQGQLQAALRTYEHSIQLALAHGEPMPLGTEDLYTGISKLHRERGDLEAAAEALRLARQFGERIKVPDWQHRWCTAQARLSETREDLEGALNLLREAERLYVRTPVPEVQPIGALKAQIWLSQGRLADALAWAHEQNLAVTDELSFLREFEHITLARVLIAQYKHAREDSAIQEAMALLARLLQAAEAGERTGSVIQILVLQALAHEAQGKMRPALTALARALMLAEPEGYIHSFVDEGPPLAQLLHEARLRGIAPAYVRRLLAALPATVPPKPELAQTPTPESEWVDPLSEREVEVLQLIAEGLTNQQIADRLYLSLNTVKVHTRNIYSKLGVHHRTGAVAKARALGVLPSS